MLRRNSSLKLMNALESGLGLVMQSLSINFDFRVFDELMNGSPRLGVVSASDFLVLVVVFAFLDGGGEFSSAGEFEQLMGVELDKAVVNHVESVLAELFVGDRLEAGRNEISSEDNNNAKDCCDEEEGQEFHLHHLIKKVEKYMILLKNRRMRKGC